MCGKAANYEKTQKGTLQSNHACQNHAPPRSRQSPTSSTFFLFFNFRAWRRRKTRLTAKYRLARLMPKPGYRHHAFCSDSGTRMFVQGTLAARPKPTPLTGKARQSKQTPSPALTHQNTQSPPLKVLSCVAYQRASMEMLMC